MIELHEADARNDVDRAVWNDQMADTHRLMDAFRLVVKMATSRQTAMCSRGYVLTVLGPSVSANVTPGFWKSTPERKEPLVLACR